MIIIQNRFSSWMLGSRYAAMCLSPFLLVARGFDISENAATLNHERIHARQQLEMLWFFFFAWYLSEYLIRIVLYRSHMKAYLHLAHEREAYAHAGDPDYLHRRRPYAWVWYIFNQET